MQVKTQTLNQVQEGSGMRLPSAVQQIAITLIDVSDLSLYKYADNLL